MTNSEIIELADKLVASVGTDLELSDKLNKMTVDECKLLDRFVFECKACNNWFYQRDNATFNKSEWICTECI